MTLRVFQRARWRLKWAGWRRWVHGLVIPTFLIRRKIILFLRHLDFCAFEKSTDFKICDIIISITSSGISTSAYVYWILSTLKKKSGQILVCCKTNISSMPLVQDWRLKTSFRLFYDLLKWQYGEIWQFLIFNIYNFQMSIFHLSKKK